MLPSRRTDVEFRILGPLEVLDDGRALTLGGSRQRVLLALLLTRANEVVSRDRLVDGLWADDPPAGATNALQYHVSQLRKTLAAEDRIVTRDPGYLIRLEPDELDLLRFERLVDESRAASPERAAERLREALALWRGPALADLAHEPFGQAEIARLEELRLAAVERRMDADLELGRHAELVGELEALVREHPLREQLRALLMRALYAGGRQAEALSVYRRTRELLVDELGIEPGPALQQLEQAILRQDAELSAHGERTHGRRAIMVLVREQSRLDALLAIAEPLSRRPERELILARLLAEGEDITAATATLTERRVALARVGVAARVAAYTTPAPGEEAVLLSARPDVDLILVDAPSGLLDEGTLGDDLHAVLDRAPCDVAVLTGSGERSTGPIVAPFGGADHDWSAIEVAAWLAGSLGTTLRLLGTEADPAFGRRDASRLLARASLVVQEVIGIATEPMLVPRGERGVLEGAHDARLVVVGLSERWRSEGIGQERRAVALHSGAPTLLVRRGLRPSGVAPADTYTRFTWTLGDRRAT